MKRGLKNLSWLLSDNLLSTIIGALTSMMVVRYLGPEKNGILSYCIAYISLWSVLSDLGSANIIQKEEILNDISTSVLIGTGLVIGLIGGILTSFGATVSLFLFKEEKGIILCVFLLGCSYIIKAVYVIKYILLARLRADLLVKANVRIQLIVAFIKVFLILIESDLYLFIGCYCVEALLQAIIYLRVARESLGKISFSFSLPAFKKIILQSWPNMISSVAVVIYMKSDQIMIRNMMDDATAGIYAVAVTISEFAQFIPVAIANTMLPILTEKFNEDSEDFSLKYIDYFEKMLLTIAFIIIFTLLSAWILVYVMYGSSYMKAVPIVRMYALSELFVAIGVAEGAYVNLHRLQKKSMYVTCIAAGVNILLNYALISILGCEGAVIATIVAMFLQTVVLYAYWKDTRLMIKLLGSACLFRNTRKQLKNALRPRP